MGGPCVRREQARVGTHAWRTRAAPRPGYLNRALPNSTSHTPVLIHKRHHVAGEELQRLAPKPRPNVHSCIEQLRCSTGSAIPRPARLQLHGRNQLREPQQQLRATALTTTLQAVWTRGGRGQIANWHGLNKTHASCASLPSRCSP